MPCSHSPHSSSSWTLIALIGSYLDLALAYIFLLASTLFFFASKLLSFFNLPCPCPCSNPLLAHNPPLCFQTRLLDSTRDRIESLSTSIRTRFPFDVVFENRAAIASGPAIEPLSLTGAGDDGERRRVRRRRKGKTVLVTSPVPMRVSWKQAEEGEGDNFGGGGLKEEGLVGDGLQGGAVGESF